MERVTEIVLGVGYICDDLLIHSLVPGFFIMVRFPQQMPAYVCGQCDCNISPPDFSRIKSAKKSCSNVEKLIMQWHLTCMKQYHQFCINYILKWFD